MVTSGGESRNVCILQTLCITFFPYFHPFDTDGVTSALHTTARSRAQAESNTVSSAFVSSCPLPHEAVRLK